MVLIQIPTEWDDNDIVLLREFSALIKAPLRTVREWRQQGTPRDELWPTSCSSEATSSSWSFDTAEASPADQPGLS